MVRSFSEIYWQSFFAPILLIINSLQTSSTFPQTYYTGFKAKYIDFTSVVENYLPWLQNLRVFGVKTNSTLFRICRDSCDDDSSPAQAVYVSETWTKLEDS